MQHVLVLDAQRRPLMPCRPARARLLLTQGKAAVLRRSPFLIILKESKPDAGVKPMRLKIDPGSQTTGLALVTAATDTSEQVHGMVLWAAELTHRGSEIHRDVTSRGKVRRSRRFRHTWYREARYHNRTRPAGWLPPSLESRVHNVATWVQRLARWCPIGAISFEAVRFDTQLLQHPDIAGMEYQRGDLAGIEVREYLLLKWGYRCAYCHQQATSTNWWEIDHIMPRSRGGSDRVSNLALACHKCNSTKGDQTALEFGHPEVQAQARAPLMDAAAVNSTRRAVHQRLLAFGMPVETNSGGLTKWNRTQHSLPKTHWLDACCVGRSTPTFLRGWQDLVPLLITAQRWQRRQMCLMNEHGFPRTRAKGASRVQGFKTGDMVKAVVPSGKPEGIHVGKVAVKARGYFTVASVPDVPSRYCRLLQHADGYEYTQGVPAGRSSQSAPGQAAGSGGSVVREETRVSRD
ncbi:MAG: HNH endonuclease [Chloroflexi bacterium]|nr:MAG: HNH endonuclease [Chloroflexota bacterium]